MARPDLMNILLSRVDQSKILMGKKVLNVIEQPEDVEGTSKDDLSKWVSVHCSDGW